MQTPGSMLLRWLTEVHHRGRPLVLLFDLDGTLTPLVDHRRQVRLAPSTRDLLADLAHEHNLFVGVISGRSLAELKEIVGLQDLYYAGTCGLELDLLGLQVSPPNADSGQALLAEVYTSLAKLIVAFPGAEIERKPLGVRLQYRELPEPHIAPFQAALIEQLARYGDNLHSWTMAKSTEIIPAFGWSKATAVEKILEDAARDALPFYAGDEANDADAISFASELGGLGVGVGNHAPSTAHMVFDSPRSLMQVFHRFLAVVQSNRMVARSASLLSSPDAQD